MRQSFLNTLCELAEQDKRIWLLSGDLGFSVLEPFIKSYPERFINAGVAEQNMSGVAAGLSLCGKIVFTYSIANFPTLRCFEQIRNDICYHKCNVNIVAVGGGLSYGSQGYTHHGIEDLAVMRALPNMTVLVPADPVETRLATAAAAAGCGPCYIRLGKSVEPVLHESDPDFEIGKAVYLRKGKDAALIGTGPILSVALKAAEYLEKQDISVSVLSMHTLKPLDTDTILKEADATRCIITIEEHSLDGGLGSMVGEALARAGSLASSARAGLTGVKFRTIGIQAGREVLTGSQEFLRKHHGLDVASIVQTVRTMVQ